jgi:hypothetical protein
MRRNLLFQVACPRLQSLTTQVDVFLSPFTNLPELHTLKTGELTISERLDPNKSALPSMQQVAVCFREKNVLKFSAHARSLAR